MPGRCGLILAALLIPVVLPLASEGEKPAPEKKADAADKKSADKPPMRLDQYGDPLPPGAIARFGTVRLRQSSPITRIDFAPDGKVLAVGGYGQIVLWNVGSAKKDRVLEQRGLSPKRPLKPDELTTGRVHPEKLQKQHAVDAIAFTSDGRYLAAYLGSIHVWDLKTDTLLPPLGPSQISPVQNGLLFLPDGKTLLVGAGNSIHLCDVSTGNELRQLTTPIRFDRLSLSGNGKLLAVSDGRSMLVLELATGKMLQKFSTLRESLSVLAFSPDNRCVLAGNTHGVLSWEVSTGARFNTFEGNGVWNEPMDLSRDGKLLAARCANNLLALWDTTTRKQVASFPCRVAVSRVRFSADSKTLVAAAGPVIRVWDVTNCRELHCFPAHVSYLTTVLFDPMAKRLTSLSWDSEVIQWSARAGVLLHRVSASGHWSVYVMALSPDGSTLALGGQEVDHKTKRIEQTIRLVDAVTHKELRKLCTQDQAIVSLAFSPDGQILVSGTSDKKIQFWQVRTGKQPFEDIPASGRFVAFARDGKTLYAVSQGGKEDKSLVQEWDVRTGKAVPRTQLTLLDGLPLAISPDARFLATMKRFDSSIKLWDLRTGKKVSEFVEESLIRTSAFSRNGRMLVTASGKNHITLWEILSGKKRLQFRADASSVLFSADTKLLASGNFDSTILLWDVAGHVLQKRSPNTQMEWQQLQASWDDLASQDGMTAFQALRSLVSSSEPAVQLIAKRAKPVPAVPADKLRHLINDLGHTEFKRRDAAFRELAGLQHAAQTSLEKALSGTRSEEARQRIAKLLHSLQGPLSLNRLRTIRAIEALEWIADESASSLLVRIAKGAPDVLETEEARSALQRLGKDLPQH